MPELFWGLRMQYCTRQSPCSRVTCILVVEGVPATGESIYGTAGAVEERRGKKDSLESMAGWQG